MVKTVDIICSDNIRIDNLVIFFHFVILYFTSCIIQIDIKVKHTKIFNLIKIMHYFRKYTFLTNLIKKHE